MICVRRGAEERGTDVHLVNGDITDIVRVACKVGQKEDISACESRFHGFSVSSIAVRGRPLVQRWAAKEGFKGINISKESKG